MSAPMLFEKEAWLANTLGLRRLQASAETLVVRWWCVSVQSFKASASRTMPTPHQDFDFCFYGNRKKGIVTWAMAGVCTPCPTPPRSYGQMLRHGVCQRCSSVVESPLSDVKVSSFFSWSGKEHLLIFSGASLLHLFPVFFLPSSVADTLCSWYTNPNRNKTVDIALPRERFHRTDQIKQIMSDQTDHIRSDRTDHFPI